MNASLITLEICVIALGTILMLADFWMPAERKKFAAYAAIAALGGLLLISLSGAGVCSVFGTAFNGTFVEDALALFFKRFFIVAAILVLFMAAEFSDRIAGGISEYYSLIVFALAGMLFAASANDFAMLFVSIELITITFYVLVSFQRSTARVARSGREISDPRRAVVGVHGFRHRADLGNDRQTEFHRTRGGRRAVSRPTKFFCSACCSCWSASVSRSPRFHFKSGRRMFIKARRRRRRRFSPSVPRPPDLSCCCAFCSRRFRV